MKPREWFSHIWRFLNHPPPWWGTLADTIGIVVFVLPLAALVLYFLWTLLKSGFTTAMGGLVAGATGAANWFWALPRSAQVVITVLLLGYFIVIFFAFGRRRRRGGALQPTSHDGWQGIWKARDKEGHPFRINLKANGEAEKDRHPPHEKDGSGRWTENNGQVQMTWVDEWTDFFKKSGLGFKIHAYRPHTPLDGPPHTIQDATKEESGDSTVSITPQFLTGHRWKLVYNPHTGDAKGLSFEDGGAIILGHNDQEHRWRLVGDRLEVLNKSGETFSRFRFNSFYGAFISTNDTLFGDSKNQCIYLQS